MADAKRKPGRPPKNIKGLLLGSSRLKDGSNGPPLRDLQPAAAKPKESVLQPPHETKAAGDGTLGVFGTAGPVNSERTQSADKSNPLPDSSVDLEEPLAAIFKRLLREVAAPNYQDGGASPQRNADVLARTIMQRALDGNQFAIEVVLDRAEGKAVRGTPVAQVDTAIEEQIGRAEVAALNQLLKKE